MNEAEFEREFWVTRELEVVRIPDLEDSHLLNILKMIERFYAVSMALDYVCLPEILMPRGDAATDSFDDAFREFQESGPEASFSGYNWLREEAFRRGLTTLEERERYTSDLCASAVAKLGGFGK